MPKPMTIEISVEEVAFGKVFRTLDGMPGVVSINIKGTGPKAGALPAPRTMGKTSQGTTARCIVFKFLVGKKKAVQAKVLAGVAEEAGKARNSIGNVLFEGVKAKHLIRSKDGYKLTTLGQVWLKDNCKGEH